MNPGTKISGSVTLAAPDPYPPDTARHVFTFGDGAKIAFFAGSDGAYYAIRSSGGSWQTPVKWSATTLMTTRPVFFEQVVDTIHAFYPDTSTPARLVQSQFPYSSSSHTMGTLVTTPGASIPFASQGRYVGYYTWQYVHGQWDSTRSVWHIAVGAKPYLAGSVIFVIAVTNGTSGSAPGLSWSKDQVWTAGATGAWQSLRTRLSQSGNTLYVSVADGSRAALYNLPVGISSGSYSWFSSQSEYVLGRGQLHTTELDSSGNLDLLTLEVPISGNATLYAVKRTGTAIYTATIPLQSGSLDTTYSEPVTCYDVHTGDLWVFYQTNANQPNFEVWGVQRKSNVWQQPKLIAGGDASGYIHVSCARSYDSSSGTNNTADLLFVNYAAGGPAAALYYYGVASGTAPSTPSGLTPTGSVTGIAPTYSWTYSNPTPNDTQSAREVKVVRTSDSHTMWDSGWVSDQTSYLAANVASGVNNLTVPHGAGSQFQTGQQVLVGTGGAIEVLQVSSVTPGTGSNPDTVTFTTNLANPHNQNDPITTGGATQQAVHGQVSNTTDGNYVAPTALAYGTQYQWQVRTKDLQTQTASGWATAAIFTGYHTPGPTITQVVSNAQTLTSSGSIESPVIGVTFSYSQGEGNTAVSYLLNLLASDQATVLASTGATISLASGGNETIPDWNPGTGADLENGQQYYLELIVTDSQGLVGTSALFGILADWATPPQPIAFGADAAATTAEVDLTWQNLSDNFVPNGDFETLTGGIPNDWTAGTSGGGSTSVPTDSSEPGTSDTVVEVVASSGQQAYWTAAMFAVDSSDAYVLSLWVKALVAGTVQVLITWYDGSGTNLGTTSETLATTTAWNQTGFVINSPPAGTAQATVRIGCLGTATGTIEIDKVQLETGLTMTDYRNNGVGVVESVNVLIRPSTGGAWTILSSGSLRSSLTVLPQLLTAYDYGVQSVSTLGVTSDVNVVGNVSLELCFGTYGIVYTDTTDQTKRVFIGMVESWDTFALLHHNEDLISWVPPGLTKPVELYGLTDYLDMTQRKYDLPFSDAAIGGDGSTDGALMVAALLDMAATHNPVLYRDKDGRYLIITIKNYQQYEAEEAYYVTTFDANEIETDLGVIVF